MVASWGLLTSVEVSVRTFARRTAQCLRFRRIVVWIAAYALALQTLLTPLLAAPMRVRDVGGTPLFALCLVGRATGSPVPSDNHHSDIHCKLCISGGLTFAGLPDPGSAWIETTTTLLQRVVTDNPVLSRPALAANTREGLRGWPEPWATPRVAFHPCLNDSRET